MKPIKEMIALELFNVSIDSGEIMKSDIKRIEKVTSALHQWISGKKVDLNSIPSYKVGFKEYDRAAGRNELIDELLGEL